MACPLWATLLLFFFGVLLQAEENVFVKREHANTIFGRAKRANSYLKLEEMMQGNLERECFEELCSYEEAREVFEDDTSTLQKFWKNYQDDYTECHIRNGYCDQFCSMENGTLQCSCTTGYTLGENGKSCIPSAVGFEDCSRNNGGCGHFCSQENHFVQCSCTKGYTLGENRKSCIPNEQFVWGKLYSGKSPSRPWQALLVGENNETFCEGTIVDEQFVLISAHCINETIRFHIVVGIVDMQDGRGSKHEVDVILLHSEFDRKTHDYDIALIKLKKAIIFSSRVVPACIPEVNVAERLLMNETLGISSYVTCTEGHKYGKTNLQLDNVPCIPCPENGIHNHREIPANMFGTWSKVVCQNDGGGPHIHQHNDTYFVTGIASWQGRYKNKGTIRVFTNVSHFKNWIETSMCHFKDIK